MAKKLHELLAAEETVVSASEKLLAETNEKFNKHTEFFTGSIRTLKRIKDSPEDAAAEAAARREKVLPTTVGETVSYAMDFVGRALDLKLRKHLTNQVAKADIVMPDGSVLMKDAPVDFLLDLEKALPRYRDMFSRMPTIDPSRNWVKERDRVFKTQTPIESAQTEKRMIPVVLYEATKEHPAQVKEVSKDEIVGTFSDTFFSGAATSQQKADTLKLLDDMIAAVKQARMRANSVEVVEPRDSARKIAEIISAIVQ